VQDKLTRRIDHCMIDKSNTEIRALTDCGIKYFLCLFHVLQAWERFVRSGEGGIKEKGIRKAVMADMQHLARTKDKGVFKQRETDFKEK
jgi:hypothetical protein